jgi:hypothetical protein
MNAALRVLSVTVSLLATLIDAQGCSASDPWTCGSQSCCPSGGPACYWFEYWGYRKRGVEGDEKNDFHDNAAELPDGAGSRRLSPWALEVNQMYHLDDERNFTRFINGEVPVLPRHVALRDKL